VQSERRFNCQQYRALKTIQAKIAWLVDVLVERACNKLHLTTNHRASVYSNKYDIHSEDKEIAI